MKVVCINNRDSHISLYKSILTLDKSYDAIDEPLLPLMPELVRICYRVTCDDGKVRAIVKSRFITLEAHREQMLNKIFK
jgi:hypothetical protein|tara:strand:- start:65 stop:301 length:237 start_codon:yes stop_codon:yes gene_type:complete